MKQISPAYTLGLQGEDLAADFLSAKGYKILDRRYRIYGIEIDIIAENDGFLVVVEVKARSSDFFACPSAAVNLKKQQRIIRAADIYSQKRDIHKEIRFDIISIIKNEDQQDIEHIEGAFLPFM